MTSISNYLAVIVALGFLFIKMHHCASSLMTYPPIFYVQFFFWENQCFYSILILNRWNDLEPAIP